MLNPKSSDSTVVLLSGIPTVCVCVCQTACLSDCLPACLVCQSVYQVLPPHGEPLCPCNSSKSHGETGKIGKVHVHNAEPGLTHPGCGACPSNECFGELNLSQHHTALIPPEGFQLPLWTHRTCRSVTVQQMSSLAHRDYCRHKCEMYFNSSLNKLCLERRAKAHRTSADYTRQSPFCGSKRV